MEVIHSYTRADAIDDGILVDVSPMATRAGFKFPVATTRAVYTSLVEVQRMDLGDERLNRVEEVESQHKENLKLIELLLTLRTAIRTPGDDPSRVDFTHDGQKLYALCGPGDDARPVITVMLPEED